MELSSECCCHLGFDNHYLDQAIEQPRVFDRRKASQQLALLLRVRLAHVLLEHAFPDSLVAWNSVPVGKIMKFNQ